MGNGGLWNGGCGQQQSVPGKGVGSDVLSQVGEVKVMEAGYPGVGSRRG